MHPPNQQPAHRSATLRDRLKRLGGSLVAALLMAGASGIALAQADRPEGTATAHPAAASQASSTSEGEQAVSPEKADGTPKGDKAAKYGRTDEGVADEARVELANRTVTIFRGSLLGVGPERRARRAEAALQELIELGGEGKVTLRVEPQGHAVLIDGELAFFLVPADADRLNGQTLSQASQAARQALQRALDETREFRDVRRLLRHAGIALVATLVAALIIAVTWRARRWASDRIAALVGRGGAGLRIAGAELLQADRLAMAAGFVVRALSWLVVLAVIYQWLGYVFSQFPYTRPWGEGLTRFLFGAVARLGQTALKATPDLAVAVLIFFIARGVIALARPVFTRAAASEVREGGWLDADTARPTQRLFNIAVVLFALVMAYPYLPGSDSEAFKGMSVLIGLMLTLGGSSLISQAASGLVIMYSRTLRVGEFVRVDTHEGTVTRLGAFTTRIRTGLGEELTLPNNVVLGTVTKNYSRTVRGNGFVVDTVVTIGYDTPWRQVEAMLLEAARRTPGVLADPAPRVFQTALSDFYPEYRLVCQASPTEPRPRAEVLSMLHARIQDVFNEHGVQIMSPHYLGDPSSAKVVPPQDWYREPARRTGDPPAR